MLLEKSVRYGDVWLRDSILRPGEVQSWIWRMIYNGAAEVITDQVRYRPVDPIAALELLDGLPQSTLELIAEIHRRRRLLDRELEQLCEHDARSSIAGRMHAVALWLSKHGVGNADVRMLHSDGVIVRLAPTMFARIAQQHNAKIERSIDPLDGMQVHLVCYIEIGFELRTSMQLDVEVPDGEG